MGNNADIFLKNSEGTHYYMVMGGQTVIKLKCIVVGNELAVDSSKTVPGAAAVKNLIAGHVFTDFNHWRVFANKCRGVLERIGNTNFELDNYKAI